MKIKAIKVSKKELNKITQITTDNADDLGVLFENKNKWIQTCEPERYLKILDQYDCFYQVKYSKRED